MSELEGQQKMTANFTESACTTDVKIHTSLIMLGSIPSERKFKTIAKINQDKNWMTLIYLARSSDKSKGKLKLQQTTNPENLQIHKKTAMQLCVFY